MFYMEDQVILFRLWRNFQRVVKGKLYLHIILQVLGHIPSEIKWQNVKVGFTQVPVVGGGNIKVNICFVNVRQIDILYFHLCIESNNHLTKWAHTFNVSSARVHFINLSFFINNLYFRRNKCLNNCKWKLISFSSINISS